jgi:Domain of unknown function (DUF4350)
MKQKLLIILFLFLMIGLLVGLNAASYVGRQKLPDTEEVPNRSTFNSGATGASAFFDLLSQTGHKAVRWQESPAALVTAGPDGPAVFVMIGRLRRELDPEDAEPLFRWVAAGGRLVVVDREPSEELVATTANWQIWFRPRNVSEIFNVDPSDQQQMTREAAAVKPVQPTVLSIGVDAIQPSRFASAIQFERNVDEDKRLKGFGNGSDSPPPPPAKRDLVDSDPIKDRQDSPGSKSGVEYASPSSIGPIAHITSGLDTFVLEAPFGEGRIVYISDPYLFSNAGIGLADNVQLAVNTVAVKDRVIAFDEYHQGYGKDRNRFLQFFEGTPVIAIFLQAIVLVGFIFLSKSRRFARPVPEPEPDRLSKLEYVSAMAELQQRSRAFDLAVENIYSDFRRRVARTLGVDNLLTGYSEMARQITDRSGESVQDVSGVLFNCEEIIRGEPTNKSEVLELITKLRRIEAKLGISRTAREKRDTRDH